MNKPITKMDYTPIQLVIPLELTKIIDISDPVYSFNEVMNHMDLNKYFTASYYYVFIRCFPKDLQIPQSALPEPDLPVGKS